MSTHCFNSSTTYYGMAVTPLEQSVLETHKLHVARVGEKNLKSNRFELEFYLHDFISCVGFGNLLALLKPQFALL